MKLTTLVFLFAATSTFNLSIIEDGMITDTDPEKCFTDVKSLMENLMKMKHAKDVNELIQLILALIPSGQDAVQSCRGMTCQQVRETLYNHMNEDGQNCLGDWKEQALNLRQLLLDIKAKTVTLQEVVDRVTAILQSLPKMCEECRNARLN